MNWSLLRKVVQLAGNRAWLLVCWTQDSVLNRSTQRGCGVCSPAFLFLLLLFRASDLSMAVSEYSRWPESVLWRSFPSWGSKYCHSFLYGKGAPFQFGFLGSCHWKWPSIIHNIFPWLMWWKGKMQGPIPLTSCEVAPHSVMLIMIPPRPVLISYSSWITKYLICV